MAVSRDTRHGSGTERLASLVELFLSLSRYDLVLAVIPVAFVLATGVAAVTGLSLRAGVLVASLAGALAVVDALFLHPPQRPGREPE